MRIPVENFAKDIAPADADGKLDAPAFHRNKDAIAARLGEILAGRSGLVLEIGSGTGQHAATFASAFPHLEFQPTDPVAEHVASIAAWGKDSGLANLREPAQLDALAAPWTLPSSALPRDGLTAVLAINVIHIAPWPVAEGILAGAARHLAADGLMIFYGPYKKDGQTAASNVAFDQALRAKNPQFGVRELGDLVASAEAAGLALRQEHEMPANNLTLVFARKV